MLGRNPYERGGAATSGAAPRALTLQRHPYPGILLTFCGVDGSGKTSIIGATTKYLEDRGLDVFRTYTPTPRIRKNPLFRTIVDTPDAESRARVDVLGLCLQITGDLLQHLKDTIVPRLEQGEVVLCDRYVYTSQAEVRTRSDDPEIEDVLVHLAQRMPRPDRAFSLDVPAELAKARVLSREDERDKPIDHEFHARQVATYTDVARANGLIVVSSDRPIEESFADVRAELDACLVERGRS